MNNPNRKSTLGLIALSAALVMPMAFAQSDTEAQATQAQTEQATPVESTPPAESATGAADQSTDQVSGAATSSGKPGWEQMDVDKDGAISKQEATANAGLSQIFDQADADTNGALTTDEYKAFVSKHYGEPKTK
jgi:hypothetical protein